MNDLYEALEICLQEIEQGADIETVLFRYPDLAEELRPILQASAGARSMAVAAPSTEVMRRNRAKLLQHATQMRGTKANSSERFWFASLRRVAVALALVAILFVSGTGLVGASSDTLPGDNLYPVKRTWEGLRLLFTFDGQERETLELEHENERLYELRELLTEGRSEEVDFNGLVESQNGDEWIVAGIRVSISNETEIRDSGIGVGSAVRVRGVTQGNDTVLAERIRLLSSDAKLPDADHGHDDEDDHDNEDNSGPGSGDDVYEDNGTDTPDSENDNSGSNTNENENSNGRDDGNDNNSDSSGSDDDNGNSNHGSNDNDDDSNDNGNDSSGGNEDNNNDDNSGDGDNSGPGGGDDHGDSGGEDNEEEDD